MEAKTDPQGKAPHRTDRADFQATSDPAVLESADRGEVELLDYDELYNLWERQQWATQDLDFSQDKIDWNERFERGGALPAHVRALLLLHRRAEGRRGARPDHARRPDRGPANLPLHPDRRRGPPRPLLRALLPRGRRRRFRRPARHARPGRGPPQRRLQRPLRRDARLAGQQARLRPDRPRRPGRGGDDLPHGDRGNAGPHRASTSSSTTTSRWARCRASSRASTTSPATSTATSPSARASCATAPRRATSTARRSSARCRRRCRSPTRCWSRPGPPTCPRTSSSSASPSPTRASSRCRR